MAQVMKLDEAKQPHSVEAEQQLLGALLLRSDIWPDIAPVLDKDHFYDPVHAAIYEQIAERHRKGHLVSPVTLASSMDNHEGLLELGGSKYLVTMAGAACSTLFAKEYAKLIVERKIARDALQLMADASSEIIRGEEPQESVARLQGGLMALPEAEGRASCISMTTAATEALKETYESYQGNVMLLKTGIDALDKILRGLAPGDLMLLGGATSMGKTAIAIDIAHRIAARGGIVGFPSMEMDAKQLFARITSSLSKVPYEMARAADEMSEETFRSWVAGGEKAAELPIYTFPRHVRDIAAISATAQGLKMRHGRLDVVIVDYAQLCRAPGREFRERMVNVSIGLKHMAKVLDCPVIALVQLDRRLGDRPDPRPQTYDIKETSQFETDADQIVFCHRQAYYLERRGPERTREGTISLEARADWEAELSKSKNLIELIVRKNRHGRLATAEVGCHMPTNRFWNLHRDDEQGFI